MAAKKNKAKNKSNKNKWHWLNLPQEVIRLLNCYYRTRRRGEALHYIGTNATTKSWEQPTTRCSRSGENCWPKLYLLDNSSNLLSASRRQQYFPASFTIRSAATDFRQIMVYYTDPRRYGCTIIDPFDANKKCIQFTSIIGFQSRFYALSLQGALAVIEDVDSHFTITGINSKRAAPSVKSRYFKEYLIEVNGEIIIVFLIHQKSLEIVNQVEVFRLCDVKLKWIKVERLQGKALFFDVQSYWVNSTEIGCRGDCVYFTQGSNNSWWLYDMGSCCISPV